MNNLKCHMFTKMQQQYGSAVFRASKSTAKMLRWWAQKFDTLHSSTNLSYFYVRRDCCKFKAANWCFNSRMNISAPKWWQIISYASLVNTILSFDIFPNTFLLLVYTYVCSVVLYYIFSWCFLVWGYFLEMIKAAEM